MRGQHEATLGICQIEQSPLHDWLLWTNGPLLGWAEEAK
jgi:hypothetical protein